MAFQEASKSDSNFTQPTSVAALSDPGAARKDLSPEETFWANLRPWLEERGYELRARYQPGWQASWLAKGFSGRRWYCEDYQRNMYPWVMDAMRVHDGALVMLKCIKKHVEDSEELQFAEPLSSETFSADPRNRCTPIYEIMPVPNSEEKVLVVMPLFYTFQMQPEFDTVGEVVDFFRQTLEGLLFLHRHNIAHRDCKYDNILADSGRLFNYYPHPLLPDAPYHGQDTLKQRYSRTTKPIRYYYIDFGLSKRYTSRTGNFEPSPWGAGIYEVPEFKAPSNTPTDPFPVDIYMLGMMFRQHFLDRTNVYPPRVNLEWMNGLASDMTATDPKARPTIEEALERFNALVRRLGFWQLRAPVNRSDEPLSPGYKMRHWIIQASRALRFIPAVPCPAKRRQR